MNRSKLTKKFLMEQPTGSYIVSNCYKLVGLNKFKPVFQERVTRLEQRQARWERIKAARANGKLCVVYPGKEDYDESKSTR